MRILVVGAGPTGLTAAVELARRGLVPDVIDRKENHSTLSRAVGILPRSLNILKLSGVTDRLITDGIKVNQVKFYHEEKSTLTVPLSGSHPDWDFILALAQDRTEAALRDTFVNLGGLVSYGTALSDLHEETDGVVVRSGDGDEDRYDLVIGADGTRSRVRECLSLDYIGFDLRDSWSIADVEAENWPNGNALTITLVTDGRIVVVAPLEAGRLRVISNTEDALGTLPIPIDVSHIRQEALFKISVRQVSSYNVGRVYLAGDAAHCYSPAGGRGMNLGIADAADLAARIIDNTLDRYSTARRLDGANAIAVSERLRRIVTAKSGTARVITRAAFSTIDAISPLQQRLAKKLLDS